MEIKIIKKLNGYIFLSFCLTVSFEAFSNNENTLSSNKLKSSNVENKIVEKSLNQKDPFKDITIDLNKILHYTNGLKFEKDIEKLDFNSNEFEIKNELILDKNDYFLIQTKDNKKLIFDGSILITFNELPNFQNYAAINGLTFTKDLSDINTAIFKVINFLDLKIIIENLKEDPSIKSIELNTINLNLKPK
jgi:hypothetical protein